jgi:colanic acid/amylovoran biosynthesis glycosyltransferase
MDKPLRIGIFVGAFPVISETFILRQITGLIDLGHSVRILSDTRPEPGAAVQPQVEKCNLLQRTIYMEMPQASAPWEMPIWPISGQTWLPGSEQPISNLSRCRAALPVLWKAFKTAPGLTCRVLRKREFGYRAASLSSLYRLARVVEHRNDFDVVHAHFGPVGESFRFARELCHTPMVVSFHGYDFSTVPRKEGSDVYRKLFATADAVTVNSEFTRGSVEPLGCPPEKLRHLPVGFDPTEFEFRARTNSEPLRILTVARLVEIKGHEFAIRAVGLLKQEGISVQYDIVGDGPLRKSLEKLAHELGLQKIVTFHGAQTSTAIKTFMDQAHIFVLTSVTVEGDQEGQGLVLQEAQACGIPVVATRHGAFPEGLIDGNSGFLVPERDPNALAEKLIFLYSHPELWPNIGQCGRDFVLQKYDIRKLNEQLVDIYRDVIATYRGQHK